MLQYKKMFFLDITDMEKDVDFELVTHTAFDANVRRFYGVDNHKIDDELVDKLGLGIVRSKHLETQYIYDPSGDNLRNEMIKLHIYYQLTHPEFDHVELERWIFGHTEGINTVLKIIGKDGLFILSRLKEIFNEKNGKVIAFPK